MVGSLAGLPEGGLLPQLLEPPLQGTVSQGWRVVPHLGEAVALMPFSPDCSLAPGLSPKPGSGESSVRPDEH